MILSSWLGMKQETDANENSKQSPDSKIEEKKPAPENLPKSSTKSAKTNANVDNKPKPSQNMPRALKPPGSNPKKFNPPPLPKLPQNQMPNFLPASKNSTSTQSTDPSTVALTSTRPKVRRDARYLY